MANVDEIVEGSAEILKEVNQKSIENIEHATIIIQESSKIVDNVKRKSVSNIENTAILIQESANIVHDLNEQSIYNVEQTGYIDQYAKAAHDLVDAVIKKSTQNIEARIDDDNDADDAGDNDWLTIRQFTIEAGKNKIEKYIQTWERGDSWLYYIEFLCEDEFQFNKRYRYKVQWSIPTRRKPIPRATASVYFTIAASTVKPEKFPCQVYYIFESSKLVHRPGSSTFREKWLKDIVDSKVILMDAVTF